VTARRVVAILVAVASLAAAPDPGAAAGPASGSRLQDSPGWVPPADPESASVRLGRRTNAPLVRLPFRGGGRSLDDLGRAIVRLMERTPTLDSLMALCVSEAEFSTILWPEFPQSRPATGLTAADGWGVLAARLRNGCNSALIDHGGLPADFVRIEVASSTAFRNFRLHDGVTLVIRDASGTERRWTWLRSIAERGGRFKIHSVRD
jgi:hypothetical protein